MEEWQRVGAAARIVHDNLGAGFSESVYQSALEVELSRMGVQFSSEAPIPVLYRNVSVGRRRPDLLVGSDELTAVELKADRSSGEEQLLQYLDLIDDDRNIGRITDGVLIQFNKNCEVYHKEVNNGELDKVDVSTL